MPEIQKPETFNCPIGSLHGADYNPRIMPPEEMGKLKRSIAKFGFVQAIIARKEDGLILGGHQRLAALHALLTDSGKTPEEIRAYQIPVTFVEGLDDSQAKLLNVALNKISGEWNYDKLGEILASIPSEATDLKGLEITGFTASEINDIFSSSKTNLLLGDAERLGASVDDAVAIPATTNIKIGDLFVLGGHRLLCGDSTKAEDVARVMNGEKASCMWTDPPYGVNYEGKAGGIQNDGADGLSVLLSTAFGLANDALADGASVYVAHPAGTNSVAFGVCFLASGWRLHETLIWVKDSMVLGHSDYHIKHESIMFGYRPGPGRRGRGGEGWYGNDSQVSVFEVPRPKRSEAHPTMKPVELITRMLANSTQTNDLVYEPFSGSGSTMMACELLGRRARAIELDPRFVQGAIDRWESHTGLKAAKVIKG